MPLVFFIICESQECVGSGVSIVFQKAHLHYVGVNLPVWSPEI